MFLANIVKHRLHVWSMLSPGCEELAGGCQGVCGVHAVAGHRVGHQRAPGRDGHLAAAPLPVNPRQPEQQQQEEGGAVHGGGGSAPRLVTVTNHGRVIVGLCLSMRNLRHLS